MSWRRTATVLCMGSLVVLLPGCRASSPKLPAPDPYFLDQRMDTLERHTASLRQEIDRLDLRLREIDRQLARIVEHPWFSSIQEHPLRSLPAPSGKISSLTGRRPPPELSPPPVQPSPPPLPKAKPPSSGALSRSTQAPAKTPDAPALEGRSRPEVKEGGESPLSRLARLLPTVKTRERTADELFRLGRRYFEAGELASAVEKLRLYLERSQHGKRADEALLLIGRAELGRGRPLAAASTLQQVVVLSPESPKLPEALYHAGESFRRLNDKVQALKFWKELAARYPSHPLAAKASDAIRRMAAER